MWCYYGLKSALHDHISQVLLLYALSATPDSSIVDVLHLRDLNESETGHVVVQSLSLGDSKAHLMNDRINFGVVFDLVLSLEINRSISRRAFFDTDGLIAGNILLLNVPQGVSVAGKADSQQLTFTVLTSQVIQVVPDIVAKKADHFGCQIVTVREGRVVASVAVNVFYEASVKLVKRTWMVCKPHHLLDCGQCDTFTDMLDVFFGDPYVFVCDSFLDLVLFHGSIPPDFICPFGKAGGA